MLRTTVFILLTALLAFGETQSGTVVSGGNPIPGATVTATCGSDKITTVTDDAGRFEMGGLPTSPCSFSVAMFGFDATPREATASSSPLKFDLQLQAHATLPGENAAPGRGRGRGGFRRQPGETGNAAPGSNPLAGNQAPNNSTPGANGSGRGGQGRGGFGRGGFGRGGFGRGQNPQAQAANGQQTAQQGFQSLSLQSNGENQIDSDIAPGDSVDSNSANQAFAISGSLSQGVQAQAGDNFGLNGFGRGGFGGPDGFGGPGGGEQFAQNGQQGNAGFGGPGGPGGGGPGGGGPGGFGGRGGGGFGGGRGGGFGGRGGGRGGPNRNFQFGNRINRGRRNQFQGNAYYTIGNSVLNARPYSFTSPETLTGAEVPKAGYASNRFGFSGGGPLTIPKLYNGDKTFWFVNYTGNRSKNGFDDVSTVPTLDERGGNFSALGTTILQPGTTTPFPGNIIPSSLLNSAATGLLSYIPAPNSPGLRNNFQLIGANPSNNDNLQVRINQTITNKDGLDVNFSYQHRDSDTIQPFGFVDPTRGYGVSGQLTYRRTITRNLINSLSWNFSRNLSQNLSSFSHGPNIEGNLGIAGVSPSAEQFGPPTLSFTNFSSLSDSTPSSNRAQTSALNEQLTQIHGKNNISYGFGFQRRQTNITSDSNARGNFNFTGIETGYDFSDYLLGLPYQSSVVTYQNDNDARYLRESALSAFATDDFRLASNLTLNGGLRWEYFSPYTEKYNQMANLDIAPGFNAVSVVLPGQTGPYSGVFPDGFIKPDYKLFSPRVGIAWKPFKARQLVVRAGYGMYYNGGVYGTIAQKLVGQPPFAVTTQVFQSATTPLTLENGFPVEQSDLIANTFAVNKDYHPGYAQNWTASIQQTLGRSYVLNVAYNGIKGTDLDVLQLPNRAPLGTPQLLTQSSLLIPNTGEFTYDNSVGNSTYQALQVQLQKRMSNHMSYQILYTFSKAIDDTSTLGGGPVLIPNDISAERALSPTDQRHQLRVQYQFQSPIANNRSGFMPTMLRGWTLGGNLTATSGTPYTATINGDSSGTGYTGDARAQATGLPVTTGAGYFNPAAFTTPAPGTFGDAGRDTIPGIPRFTLNASFFRSFRIDEKRRIEFRIDSTNPINHVAITQINTTVGSIQYGLPTNAGAMRSVTATVRLRF